MSAPTIKRLTDLSQATIDGAASVYDEAFDAASFYPVSYIWGDLPDEEKRKRQHVLFQQYVYRSISNHEMYAAYLTGSTEPDAVLVLKLPVDDGTAPKYVRGRVSR
jgi:hypothetical protein